MLSNCMREHTIMVLYTITKGGTVPQSKQYESQRVTIQINLSLSERERARERERERER